MWGGGSLAIANTIAPAHVAVVGNVSVARQTAAMNCARMLVPVVVHGDAIGAEVIGACVQAGHDAKLMQISERVIGLVPLTMGVLVKLARNMRAARPIVRVDDVETRREGATIGGLALGALQARLMGGTNARHVGSMVLNVSGGTAIVPLRAVRSIGGRSGWWGRDEIGWWGLLRVLHPFRQVARDANVVDALVVQGTFRAVPDSLRFKFGAVFKRNGVRLRIIVWHDGALFASEQRG